MALRFLLFLLAPFFTIRFIYMLTKWIALWLNKHSIELNCVIKPILSSPSPSAAPFNIITRRDMVTWKMNLLWKYISGIKSPYLGTFWCATILRLWMVFGRHRRVNEWRKKIGCLQCKWDGFIINGAHNKYYASPHRISLWMLFDEFFFFFCIRVRI